MKVIYQPSHCSGVLYQDDRHVENGGVVNTESFDVGHVEVGVRCIAQKSC